MHIEYTGTLTNPDRGFGLVVIDKAQTVIEMLSVYAQYLTSIPGVSWLANASAMCANGRKYKINTNYTFGDKQE